MSETEIQKIIKSPEFIAASTINQTITCRFCNKTEHVKRWAPFGTMKIYLCSKCLDLLERYIRHVAWELMKKLKEAGYFEAKENE